MTLNTSDYANLAMRAYDTPVINEEKSKEERRLVYQNVIISGVTYRTIEHMNNPVTGYQGTIYQRIDTGEVVVAHRGTEPPSKDGEDVQTDLKMVFQRVNPQAKDALELTRHALEYARINEKGSTPPTVTITGHSLGGTLAQITAHEFGLQAQTFNPYGAVSLQYGVPAREPHIINHVMATDPVSAASPQPGQTLMYATQTEARTLQALGYTRDRTTLSVALDVALPANRALRPLEGAVASLGSHRLANFTTVDDRGQPKPSVLTDPQARQRATEYAEMFDQYRGDVQMIRGGLSVVGNGVSKTFGVASQAVTHAADTLQSSARQAKDFLTNDAPALAARASQTVQQGGAYLEKRVLDSTLGFSRQLSAASERMGVPAPPGGWGNRAHEASAATPTPTAAMPMSASGAPNHACPLDPRDPHHPDHAMYQNVREKLQTLNASGGIRLSPTEMENGVAAIMADARASRMFDVNAMVFGEDRQGNTLKHRVVTVQGKTADPWDDMLRKIGSTDMRQAINVPAQQSYERFEQATEQELARQQAVAQQLATQAQSQRHGGPRM